MDKRGFLILMGSGETSPIGRKIHRKILEFLGGSQNVSILETPAGFQPNSEYVAKEIGKVFGSFIGLVDDVHVVPARKKSTSFSPDNGEILKPLDSSNYIFLGPGSPTYAIKQLINSKALEKIIEKWKTGATLSLSSAATIAFGKYSLPVYEIYKAGFDLFWEKGLNFSEESGLLDLTFVTHWNNKEGGENLDTGFCYMGEERFKKLLKLLPENSLVLGIDENTAVIFDFKRKIFTIEGNGNATLLKNNNSIIFNAKKTYLLSSVKNFRIELSDTELFGKIKSRIKKQISYISFNNLSPEFQIALSERKDAKKIKDFDKSDSIRKLFENAGFEIEDTSSGQKIYKK